MLLATFEVLWWFADFFLNKLNHLPTIPYVNKWNMVNLGPLIVFQIGTIINLQRFQSGEALHGFLSGQTHQAIAIYHRIPSLANGPGANESRTTWTQALWWGGQSAWALNPQHRVNYVHFCYIFHLFLTIRIRMFLSISMIVKFRLYNCILRFPRFCFF